MKKLSVFCAAMLCSFLAFSQEAEFSVVPRLEVNKASSESWNLGSSSLYTFLDGSFGDRFSYSISNHWLSSDTKSLYTNSFVPGEADWLDWAYLTYDFGPVALSAGKVCIYTGGFEFYENDVDIYDPLASFTWNETSTYFLGGQLDFKPWENTTFGFQYTQCGMAFTWMGEYGPFSSSWAAKVYNDAVFEDRFALGLGNKLSFDRCDFTLDLYSFNCDFYEAHFESTFNTTDWLDLSLVGDWTNADYSFGGVKAVAYPLGNDTMRVHALAKYDNSDVFSFLLGVTFNFNFSF